MHYKAYYLHTKKQLIQLREKHNLWYLFRNKIKNWIDGTGKQFKKEGNTDKSSIGQRSFNISDRVSERDYLPKALKWRFGRILNKFVQLHYNIQIDVGRVCKRHVNQMHKMDTRYEEQDAESAAPDPSTISNHNQF